MNALSQYLPGISPALVPNRGEQNGLRNTQFTRTSFQESNNTEITLMTAEGDKVTFSSSSSHQMNHAIYSSRAVVDGASSQTEMASFQVSEAYSIEMSIEGDLNEREMKDILKAFKIIEKVAGDFTTGKTDHLMKQAEKIAGLSSIASFEAVIQYERSVSLQTITRTAPSLPASEIANQAVQTQAAARPELPPAASPPTPSARETFNPALPSQEHAGIESLVNTMTQAILETNIDPEKAARHSHKFLDRLFEKLENLSDVKAFDAKLFKNMQSEFTKKLLSEGESEGDDHAKETQSSREDEHHEHHAHDSEHLLKA